MEDLAMNYPTTTQINWKSKMGLAIWNYRLKQPKYSIYNNGGSLGLGVLDDNSLTAPEFRGLYLKEIVIKFFRSLEDFANPKKVAISTISAGEDSFVVYLKSAKSYEKLFNKIETTTDINNIEIDLTLQCFNLAEGNNMPKKLEIDLGAYVAISLELDEEGHLDLSSEQPFSLNLFLNVDIYAPIKLSREHYNGEIAQLNQPRLANFLHRLEETLPVEFVWVDAPDYEESIGRYGFNGYRDRA
jgi:hypothetical protein